MLPGDSAALGLEPDLGETAHGQLALHEALPIGETQETRQAKGPA